MQTIENTRQAGMALGMARKARGLTQAQLAERAGISRQLVNRLEMGDAAGISLKRLLAVLSAAGVTMTFDWDGSPTHDGGPRIASRVQISAPEAPLDYPQLDDSLFDPPMDDGGAS